MGSGSKTWALVSAAYHVINPVCRQDLLQLPFVCVPFCAERTYEICGPLAGAGLSIVNASAAGTNSAQPDSDMISCALVLTHHPEIVERLFVAIQAWPSLQKSSKM